MCTLFDAARFATAHTLHSMPDLQSFASLLGASTPENQSSKKGYDGKAVRLKMTLETKGRASKTVTAIRGFQSTPEELEELLNMLKKKCGSGGQLGDNVLELQGDHRTTAERFLRDKGFEFATTKK